LRYQNALQLGISPDVISNLTAAQLQLLTMEESEINRLLKSPDGKTLDMSEFERLKKWKEEKEKRKSK